MVPYLASQYQNWKDFHILICLTLVQFCPRDLYLDTSITPSQVAPSTHSEYEPAQTIHQKFNSIFFLLNQFKESHAS